MRYNWLVRLRTFLCTIIVDRRRWYYNLIWGTNIGKGSRISITAKLDRTYPAGITIGEYTAVAFGSAILSHDFVNGVHLATKIGSYCFVGARSIIMPGITIGDHCIIAAGAVVMRDVPPRSIVTGNPGRVIERDIDTGRYGARVRSADQPAEQTISRAWPKGAFVHDRRKIAADA